MNKNKVQEQALTELNKHNRGTIALSMGVGKTLLGLKHMVDNYTDVFKALVVAPKLSIFDSWKDDAEKFNLSYLLEHVDFTTYLSINKQNLDYVYINIHLIMRFNR